MKGIPLSQLMVMFAVILILAAMFTSGLIGGGRR